MKRDKKQPKNYFQFRVMIKKAIRICYNEEEKKKNKTL